LLEYLLSSYEVTQSTYYKVIKMGQASVVKINAVND